MKNANELHWTKARKVNGTEMEEAVREYDNGDYDFYSRVKGSRFVIRHNQYTGGKAKSTWVIEDENFEMLETLPTKQEAVATITFFEKFNR